MRILGLTLLTLIGAGALWAQHEVMRPDVESGAARYIGSCAGCHGVEGDEVDGIDLAQGKFRTAESDEDLVNVIVNGVPGTAMPPSSMAVSRAREIVVYLRFLASRPELTGDVERGKEVVEGKGRCLNCHRINGVGSRVGPDLSEVGLARQGDKLELALVDPSAEVLPQNRYVRAVKQDGSQVTGRLLNHDAFSAQMITSNGLVSVTKASLREFSFVEGSPMPSASGRLTEEELADVVRYLASLRGIQAQ